MHASLPPPRTEPASHTHGILFKILSIILFAIMEAIGKGLSERYPVLQIVFFRFAFAFLPLLPFLVRDGGFSALKTRRPFAHLLRGLIGLSAMICYFFAISRLPLADTSSISFAAPLIATALSVPLLGETVGLRRWIAVGVGFAGVLIIMNPGATLINLATSVALAGAACSALTVLLIRSMTRTEHSSTIVFYFTLTGTVAVSCAVPFVWVMPTPADLGMLIVVGLLGGGGQMAMTSSLNRAPVSVLAPFEYSKLLCAAGLDFALWSTMPGFNFMIGSPIVIASGLYIVYRERQLGKSRGTAASASPDHGQSVKPPEDV